MPNIAPSPFIGSKAWDIFREILSEKGLWKKKKKKGYGKRSDMRWMGREKWVGSRDRNRSRSKDPMIQPGKEE